MSKRRNRRRRSAGQIIINNPKEGLVNNSTHNEPLSLQANSDNPTEATEQETQPNNPETEQEPTKLFGIISIIAGLIIMASGYALYSYMNNTDQTQNQSNLAQVELSAEDEKPDNQEEGLISSGISTAREPELDVEQEPILNMPREQVTITSNEWTANNYSFGDINTGEYTVISGDTLWEIAEAAYGDGSQWEVIASANDVPFLSNGNPLIIPGQVINIPNI